jgi:hypothetical protein
MTGGLGNDTYLIDNTGDVVTELVGEGTDIIKTTISKTLPVNVEHLVLLQSAAATTGTGNTLNNILMGNSIANTLYGLDGDDILVGNGGADSLWGGNGVDMFRFTPGSTGQASGYDVIQDYTKGAFNVGDRINYAENALLVGGSNAAATVTEASINSATGVASFVGGSGTTLADALADITARFTAATDAAGEFALFQVGGVGNHYLVISDGVAGLGTTDVVVQLTNVTIVGSIDLTSGLLTITS